MEDTIVQHEADTQVAKVLRQVFARDPERNPEEAVATEDAIQLLGKLHTSDQLRIGVFLLYGRENGRRITEMLVVVREAVDRHAAGQHPTFDEDELEVTFQALGFIQECTEAA